MEFISIDVETANADLSSICQIGVAHFKNGELFGTWQTLVNPKSHFDRVNVSIHGISEEQVKDAPVFPDLIDTLSSHLEESIVVSHTSFDRTAIYATYQKHGLTPPHASWLDTARVVRRTWTDRSRSGYGLQPVAEMLGIEFRHHDAMEDARAAGQILVRAIQQSGITAHDWIAHSKRPIVATDRKTRGKTSERITREGCAEGPLFGESVVFTGALSVPRREAADHAAQAGCHVNSSVTNETTLLVVGDQDITKLAGQSKSSKHRKAEQRIENGQQIRILRETDFYALLETCHELNPSSPDN